MDFTRRMLVAVAAAFGFVALLSLILYPFYRHLYIGLVLVAVGFGYWLFARNRQAITKATSPAASNVR